MALSHDYLLDYTADCLIFLSWAPSFWYSLNLSYNYGLHLSHRFGLTPHAYELLLFSLHKMGLHNKAREVENIFRGTPACHFQIGNGNQENGHYWARIYCINIGVKSNKSRATILMEKDDDIEWLQPPPRLNGLALEHQSFERLVQPVIWNFILEYQEEDGGQPTVYSKYHQQPLLPLAPSSLGFLTSLFPPSGKIHRYQKKRNCKQTSAEFSVSTDCF